MNLPNLLAKVKSGAVEIWAAFSILVGLPLVAWLYFDYRAALLVFFVASSVISIRALKGSQ